jgi:hypothetical protein
MRSRGAKSRPPRPERRRRPQPERRPAPPHSTFRRVAVFVPIEEPDRD